MEVEADAEHQEDDADFRELGRDPGVRHEAGRVGPDDDAGEEVAEDGGKAELVGEESQHQGDGERRRQHRDQLKFMHSI
jgi:hypothetical protein